MRMKRSLLLVLFGLLALALVGTGLAQDEPKDPTPTEEPTPEDDGGEATPTPEADGGEAEPTPEDDGGATGDGMDTLTAIPVIENGEWDVVISEDITAQLLAFNASEGDEVTLEVEQVNDEAIFTPYLLLLGSAGQVRAAATDAALEYEVEEDGTYYLVIADSLNFTVYDYESIVLDETQLTLTLDGATVPAGRDVADLQMFLSPLEYGVEVEGYTNPEEPVYFYAFNGSEGDTVDILVDGDGADTYLFVFAPNGIRIWSNDDFDDLSAGVEGLELPVDGGYLIMATGYGFQNAADGGYSTDTTFVISLDAE